MVEKKDNFGIKEYLKYIATENNSYFYSLDCRKEYSLTPIHNFVSECYSKSPAVIYVDNIDWIYSLVSGNL